MGEEMREGKLATFLATALTLPSAVAYAGSAPRELYGKSIIVSWTETRIQRAETDQQAHNVGIAAQMDIYISAAGRPFVRINAKGIGGYDDRQSIIGRVSEFAPGESTSPGKVDFEGRSVVVYRQFESGVRRIAIDFDNAGCKATLIARFTNAMRLADNPVARRVQSCFSSGREAKVAKGQ
jgi:hypothetical protein